MGKALKSGQLTQNSKVVKSFIGIDVQVQRGCSFAVLDRNGTLTDSGWFGTNSIKRAIPTIVDIIEDLSGGATETV